MVYAMAECSAYKKVEIVAAWMVDELALTKAVESLVRDKEFRERTQLWYEAMKIMKDRVFKQKEEKS